MNVSIRGTRIKHSKKTLRSTSNVKIIKMPSPKCLQCDCTESFLWKSVGENQHLCNDCFERNNQNVKNESDTMTMATIPSTTATAPATASRPDERKIKLRKSTRTTRYNGKNGKSSSNASGSIGSCVATTVPSKSSGIKSGRGRRSLFRRPPMKAPTISATTTYVKSLFYKGSYIQIGDIVSLCNSNYDTFYAQIRGLMVDSFCEKSAVISWLLPTQMSPPPTEQFDPSTYLIGPEEDHPRLLSCMEFVMHAPSDYYHNKHTPYPPTNCNVLGISRNEQSGFIWTNIESK